MSEPQSSALLTDLYQLTMLQGYFERGMEETAVFEFFVRRLPACRNFLIAAGLQQAVEYLENLRFTPEELDWLDRSGRFGKDFVRQFLSGLTFTGEVHAMPEGTVFFPDEPILRVTAPLPQAQLVESRLINLLQFQTLIASKAARAVLSAPDKLLVDFGMRRAHGAEAGLLAARANYLAGFAGTSTVLAGLRFGIPSYGTMAHSFIQAYDKESEAFLDFAQANPESVVLLLDTYDTEAAAHKVVALSDQLRAQGITVQGVRLDSGDLAEHARKVRRILDEGGLGEVTIFASGNLDEDALRNLADSPIDGFGVGSRLDVSADAPYLDCAYKLQEYAAQARRKRSEGKATWPGRKQVYRFFRQGKMQRDVVTLENDPCEGQPLLVPVMKEGRRLGTLPSLSAIREQTLRNLAELPDALRALETAPPHPVEISPALRSLADALDARMASE